MVSPKHIRHKTKNVSVEYPCSWYPVCLSSELKRKKTIKLQAFGRHFVAFRSVNGEVHVMQRYCPHMGVDLSLGTVDTHLTCPLHNRKFPESSCSAKRDNLPITFDSKEEAGIIFVLLGEKGSKAYPLEIAQGCQSFVATYNYSAPFQMVGMNGFDTHHLDIVHNRKLTEPAKVEIIDESSISINYKASVSGNNLRDRMLRFLNFDSVDICIMSFANSLLLFDHKKIGAQTLLGLLPVEKNRTRIFVTTILTGKSRSLVNRFKSYLIQKSIIKFLKQDFKPLWGSRFMPEGMAQPHDEFAIIWHNHYEGIPKISVCREDEE